MSIEGIYMQKIINKLMQDYKFPCRMLYSLKCFIIKLLFYYIRDLI